MRYLTRRDQARKEEKEREEKERQEKEEQEKQQYLASLLGTFLTQRNGNYFRFETSLT